MVGITTRRFPAEVLGALGKVPAGVMDLPLEAVFSDYSDSIAGAGGVPVLIPRAANPEHLVSRIDALVLSGGEDVEPQRYGSQAGPHATRHDPERDAFEVALIEAAIAAGIPILAICRGVQILNVALGGTLVHHLEPHDGLDHSMTDEHRTMRRHEVEVVEGCLLADALSGELVDGRIAVNSYHHQAVESPGRELTVVARATDGTIEAVENAARSVLGVQWHPEMHEGIDPIFRWLIERAHMRERQLT